MRAVAIGLIASVLALGSAQAAQACPIGRADVEIRDTGERYAGQPVSRPDLIGSAFHITRYSAVSGTGEPTSLGYEAYVLKGAKEQILVKRERSRSAPAIAPISWAMADATTDRAHVDWKRSKQERVRVGQTIDYVLDGPLTSLSIVVTACR